MSQSQPPDDSAAFAWTPDDVMERGVEEFKKNFPEEWKKWLAWCEAEDASS